MQQASPPPPALSDEQRAVAHAPLDEALAVVAAAGTGKTHTMTARALFLLEQGVAAEELLVLTFSRKAAGEFKQRLLRHVPGAEAATVCTFHSWSWMVVQRHWREAGFERQPTILAAEQQEMSLMRHCIVWDRLASAQADMCAWLFLTPTALWEEIVSAVAERHAPLFQACLQAALAEHESGEQQSSSGSLVLAGGQASMPPFGQLPPRLQLLLVGELHASLQRRFGSSSHPSEPPASVLELLAAADGQAPFVLRWLEGEKRRGRVIDGTAYAALCARAGEGEGQVRQRLLYRLAAAYQERLKAQCLVPLSDLPLLARQLLAGKGEALAWAQERWSHLLVDEFQDSGSCMLDLLKLLMGPRRSIVAVGCPDQTIYSFLDAAPQMFENYQRHFGARRLCLRTKYRSTASICTFGTALLHGNQRDTEGGMIVPARAGPCTPVHVRHFHTAEREAAELAGEVARLWQEEGVPHSSVCVLYRCLRLQGTEPHAPLLAALQRLGIPYVIAGQDRLADDPAVAALLSYMAASLEVDPALEAVLSLPYHGLGRSVCGALAQLQAAARLAGRPAPSLLACAEQVCSQAELMADSQRPLQGQQAGVDEKASTQPASPGLERLTSQLNSSDVGELSRLVLLLRGRRQAAAQEPLPQALQRLLQDSGLAAWLEQQQDAAGHCVVLGDGQAGTQDLGGAASLPAPLRCVLDKAEQLAAEWRQRQQQGNADSNMHGGTSDEAHSFMTASQREAEGQEMVRELLASLATDTAGDECVSLRQGEAAAQQQQQNLQRGPGVLTIGTIHSAKGLEWPVVLLPSVCQGLLPLRFRPPAWHSGDSGDGASSQACPRAHLEEERRLFHVAATRARDSLQVSFVQPPPPAEPGDDDFDVSATAATQQPEQELRCSSILEDTLRRLRCQPEVLHWVGRLPQQDCCQADWGGEEESQAGDMLRDAGNRVSGHSRHSLGAKPSLAEQVKQRLAGHPQAGKLRARGGVCKQVQRQATAALQR